MMFVITPGEFQILSCEGLITRRDEEQTRRAECVVLFYSRSRKESGRVKMSS